jgi:hypothetical protein
MHINVRWQALGAHVFLCHVGTSRVYQVLHQIGRLIVARVNHHPSTHHKERMDGG